MIDRALSQVLAWLVIQFAKLVSGVRVTWDAASAPRATPTLYFANHSSHGDFVLIWATLPADLRASTRPVAAADYWGKAGFRGFVGRKVFRALLIDRARAAGHDDPIEVMTQALTHGDSLIMFPEGTRNTGDEPLMPFKAGLYYIAKACPDVLLVPVWIENLKRVLPKGTIIPVPLSCTVNYGAAMKLGEGEEKLAFLSRAAAAVLNLRPEHEQNAQESA